MNALPFVIVSGRIIGTLIMKNFILTMIMGLSITIVSTYGTELRKGSIILTKLQHRQQVEHSKGPIDSQGKTIQGNILNTPNVILIFSDDMG